VTGAEGLRGGKRLVVGIARGGLYNEDLGYISAEHTESSLKSVFGFFEPLRYLIRRRRGRRDGPGCEGRLDEERRRSDRWPQKVTA